ncbi:MAG: CoA transferase [Streptosporangiales bacterium]|nr:CoA transferase [Streptosporangiales bacterium]MBO0891563.1 CoA transferase [Acidothermales bacterium]
MTIGAESAEGDTERPGGRPLEGVRVLDLTTFLSGPFATQILADLGADVVKLEPLEGDSSRSIPPHFVEDDSAYFLATNRGKRSVAVNLKTPEGLDVALRLIARCDVVIENFRPGVCKRLGLDVDRIRAEHPHLVWAAISGFGQSGPMRNKPAYDMVVQALAGVMSLTGEVGRPAVRLGIPAGDLVAGMYATIGILSALLDQRRTGVGRVIDVSMLDSQLTMLSYQGVYSLVAGVTPGPQGRAHDSIPTYRSFQGADGREFVVTANTERMWRDLCKVIGRPDLVDDERFADAGLRLANRSALSAVLEAEFGRLPAETWVAELSDQAVPAAVIKSVPEALADAEQSGRGMVVELNRRDRRSIRVLGNPIKFGDDTTGVAGYPPALGEHTGSVLTDDLGMSRADVDELVAKGAVRLSR